MHYQIWIPRNDIRDPAEKLRLVGLEHCAHNFDHVEATGPDDEPGHMYYWASPANPFVRDAATLEWSPAVAHQGAGQGRYQIGFVPGLPPTPSELARPVQFPGWWIPFGDDHKWLVPSPEDLPRVLLFGNCGDLQIEQVPRMNGYHLSTTFIQQSGEWQQLVKDGDDNTELEWERLRDFVLLALQVNYRITPEVANKLQLISTEAAKLAMFAAIGGLKAKQETAKK